MPPRDCRRWTLHGSGYHTDERDLQVVVTGLRIAREIGLTPQDHWRGGEVLPGPGVHDDDGAGDYLRMNLLPYFQGMGTCRTGLSAGAVADPDLKVCGIDELRVADASVGTGGVV